METQQTKSWKSYIRAYRASLPENYRHLSLESIEAIVGYPWRFFVEASQRGEMPTMRFMHIGKFEPQQHSTLRASRLAYMRYKSGYGSYEEYVKKMEYINRFRNGNGYKLLRVEKRLEEVYDEQYPGLLPGDYTL